MKVPISPALILIFAISISNCDSKDNFKMTIEKQNAYQNMKNKESLIDFDQYFKNGIIHNISFEVNMIGQIDITSNKIIACDPFYVSEGFTSPFKESIPNGTYKVFISYAQLPDWGKRICFSKIQFSNNPTVKYKLAVFSKPDVSGNQYGVDSGLGCFMDARTASYFIKDQELYYAKHKDADYYTDILAKHFNDDDSWAKYRLAGNHTVFIFSSGLGDGSYSSYFGLDSNNKMTCLITDFNTITDIQ